MIRGWNLLAYCKGIHLLGCFRLQLGVSAVWSPVQFGSLFQRVGTRFNPRQKTSSLPLLSMWSFKTCFQWGIRREENPSLYCDLKTLSINASHVPNTPPCVGTDITEKYRNIPPRYVIIVPRATMRNLEGSCEVKHSLKLSHTTEQISVCFRAMRPGRSKI